MILVHPIGIPPKFLGDMMEHQNFATTAEKIGTKAAFALNFLEKKPASYDELNQYLYSVNTDFGNRIKGIKRQVNSWVDLGLVEVTANQGKPDDVNITLFGSNVLSEVKEKYPEKIMTKGELKIFHGEAKALAEVA